MKLLLNFIGFYFINFICSNNKLIFNKFYFISILCNCKILFILQIWYNPSDFKWNTSTPVRKKGMEGVINKEGVLIFQLRRQSPHQEIPLLISKPRW